MTVIQTLDYATCRCLSVDKPRPYGWRRHHAVLALPKPAVPVAGDDRVEPVAEGLRNREQSRGHNESFGKAAPIAAAFSSDDEPADTGAELRTLRRMLESQLAILAWNDLTRRAPLQTALLKELTQLGFAHALAIEVVTQIPDALCHCRIMPESVRV